MISVVDSTCRAEAEPAAEDDAEAEAEAGRVYGGSNCNQFSDRCSEASVVCIVAQAEEEAKKARSQNKKRIPTHDTTSVKRHVREVIFPWFSEGLEGSGANLAKRVKQVPTS